MKKFIKNISKVLMITSIVFLVITAINPNWVENMGDNGMLLNWVVLTLAGGVYAALAD